LHVHILKIVNCTKKEIILKDAVEFSQFHHRQHFLHEKKRNQIIKNDMILLDPTGNDNDFSENDSVEDYANFEAAVRGKIDGEEIDKEEE